MTEPFSTTAPPSTIPTTVSSSVSSCNGVTHLFLQRLSRRRPRAPPLSHSRHSASARRPALDSPGKTAPFAGRRRSSCRIFDAHQVHEEGTRSGDVRAGCDPISSRSASKGLRSQRAAHVAHHDIGSARFHAVVQLSRSPATYPPAPRQRAMPMEIPIRVNRCGRAGGRPRRTMVRKVISGFGGKRLPAGAIQADAAVSHPDGA